jgi:hypothetical protein
MPQKAGKPGDQGNFTVKTFGKLNACINLHRFNKSLNF